MLLRFTTRRARRGTVVVALAMLSLFLTTGVARAALYLVLDRVTAPPGALVTGRTGGEGALRDGLAAPLSVFLLPESDSGRVTEPDDPRLLELGHLAVDARGNGTLSFVVPEVASGPYTLMLHCAVCAEFSAGRILLPVAQLTVTPVPPPTDAEPATAGPASDKPLVVIGAVLLGALAGLIVARRIARRRTT